MIATYRLQLSPELDFAAARALVPYLRELGVSHLYLSPTLQARSGSTHGYDVVDPTKVSETLGGEEGLRALGAEMPLILDIVPNHMGAGEENRWWPDPKVFDFDDEDGEFYRRFFDIDDLAAVRQEDPEVFALTHQKTLELLRDGVVDGVRVDHPDGLADPAGYFKQLREAGAEGIWVEKILHPGEPLRDWPVDGTVGYEFLNDAQAVFVDGAAEGTFTRVWQELTGDERSFAEVAYEAQVELATTTFAREVAWLHRLAPRFPEDVLARALATVPVYRTYITEDLVTDADREAIAGLPEELQAALLEGGDFTTRFQQTSPPVTAKGVEDTAFYRYLRLLALNEVGGDPGRFGISVDDFHAANAARPPRGLLVSTTHDTKRSADVRARIGALTEPELRGDWSAFARAWVPQAPDPVAGFLVLQTLLGSHPLEPLDRLDGYWEKALREAKLATNWVDPDLDYEESVKAWARGLLADADFRVELDALIPRVAEAGHRSALGQLLLKLTVPGVPDIYGGDEVEYRALVDPDNRRPVDFDARRRALAQPYPPPKLKLIRETLALRARLPEAFAGAYEPVPAPEGVCAFVRGGAVLVVVPVRDGVAGTVEAPGFAPVPANRPGTYQET